MEARPVDPRDTEWEVDRPTYRVYFWRGQPRGGYASEEFELRGAADVHEVLSWAEQRAEGRLVTIYAVRDGADGRGLIRLAGVDPTASDNPAP
jgi:hypothetical protein